MDVIQVLGCKYSLGNVCKVSGNVFWFHVYRALLFLVTRLTMQHMKLYALHSCCIVMSIL